jgi:RNA 2',3'-cyclic 3'-phosphodiesterase
VRLFVAVELPPAALAAAATVSAVVRERVERRAPAAHVTWIPTERMHLTIRFLGEVASSRVPALIDALSPPLETAMFTVALGDPGAFPARGAPRVLWIGFSEGGESLGRLEQEVSARLENAGIPPETRPFSPHLTLARVRDSRGLRLSALLEGVVVPPGSSGLIDAITLFESRLSPKGPTYTALHRTPLGRTCRRTTWKS